jgi:prepilin peptidase CpaA
MSLLAPLQTGCLAAFAILLIAAGWQDLRTLKIANSLSLATVGSFAVWATTGLLLGRLSAATLGLTIICALAVFAVGALGFAGGVVGGGDADRADPYR